MHVVTFLSPMTVAGFPAKAGVPYLVNNTGAGSLLTNRALIRCEDGQMKPKYRLVKVSSIDARPIRADEDYNGRKIWLFRMGGIGDIMMATPTIREIKRRWPGCTIVFVTAVEYAPILKGLQCEIREGFVPLDEIGEEDATVFLEGVIEDNPAARKTHAVQLIAEAAGVTLYNRKLDYWLSRAERGWALHKYPPGPRRRIGIQPMASSAVRSYEPHLLGKVIEALVEEGLEVFLFGKAGQCECDIPGVTNLADHQLTLRQSVAVLSTCDAVLVPDSSFLHLAAALDVPAVALFGSFPSVLRTTSGARVAALEANASCAPCFWHESGGARFPENRPCSIAGFCTVIAQIPPSQIVTECLKAVGSSHMPL